MNVLVVGTGMYVLGRDGYGNGTIFSALAEASRDATVTRVSLLGRDPQREADVLEIGANINATLGTCLSFRYRASGTRAFDEVLNDELQSGDFQCAVVATPDDTHFAIAKTLVEAGCHTLVVKPLTPRLSEAIELAALAHERKVYGAVEFHKRYDESNLLARRLLQEGAIGSPVAAEVEFSQRIDIPTRVFRDWAARSNVFQYLGVHYVDLIRFVTGYQPVAVTAVGSGNELRKLGIDTPDTVQALIIWQQRENATARFGSTMNIGWVDPSSSPAMSHQKIRIVGTHGRIDCDQTNRGIVVTRESGVQHPNPYFSEAWERPDGPGRRFGGYGYRCIRDFLNDVQGIQQGSLTPRELEGKRPTFRDALPSTAVIEAVSQCIETNKPSWREIGETPR